MQKLLESVFAVNLSLIDHGRRRCLCLMTKKKSSEGRIKVISERKEDQKDQLKFDYGQAVHSRTSIRMFRIYCFTVNLMTIIQFEWILLDFLSLCSFIS